MYKTEFTLIIIDIDGCTLFKSEALLEKRIRLCLRGTNREWYCKTEERLFLFIKNKRGYIFGAATYELKSLI